MAHLRLNLLKKGDYAMFEISRRLPVGIEPGAGLAMSNILIRFISPPRLILAGWCWNTETQKRVHLHERHGYRSRRLTEKKVRQRIVFAHIHYSPMGDYST
jgi:hypothetical protein